MKNAIAIALGGSAGALSRYYLSKLITENTGSILPYGTMIVNLIGCLLIGFFFGLFEKAIVPVELKSFITVGFIGAFTTFSTFALESINLLREGEIKLGLLNIGLSNFLGLVFVVLGIYIAGIIIQK
jgi:CrcB protein